MNVGDVSRVGTASAQSDYVSDFMIMMSSEGIELNRAFAQIKDPKLRRKVIDLVRTMAATPAPVS